MFEGLEPQDWWLIIGTVMGPILAVAATRIVDELRDNRARRNAVFVSLMSTRRAQLTPEHVQALNLIEIEFSHSARVIAELKAYMALMEERVQPLSRFERDEAVKAAHKQSDDDLIRRRRRAFGSLVQAIGKKIGRNVDRYDIVEGGYYPGGWGEAETLQLDNLRRINDILNWRERFPVHLWRMSPPVPLEGYHRPQRLGDQRDPPPAPETPPEATGSRPGEPGSPFPPPPS